MSKTDTGSITDYGFEWKPASMRTAIEVTRTSTLPDSRGAVVTIKTDRENVEVYITNTGMMRFFRTRRGKNKRHKELL